MEDLFKKVNDIDDKINSVSSQLERIYATIIETSSNSVHNFTKLDRNIVEYLDKMKAEIINEIKGK